MSGSSGGGTQSKAPNIFKGSFRAQTSTFKPLPILYGTQRVAANVIWSGNLHRVGRKSGGGKGMGSGEVVYTWALDVMMGLCEGPVLAILKAWSGSGASDSYSPSQLSTRGELWTTEGWSFLPGGALDNPWAHLLDVGPNVAGVNQRQFPGQDLAYRRVAIVANVGVGLGSSVSLPQYSWEVMGKGLVTGTGVLDANPSDIIVDLLTNTVTGLPIFLDHPEWVDAPSFADFYRYCAANGLLVSPLLDQQQSLQEVFQMILEIVNADCVWSGSVLKVVPYGDTAATGLGVTWGPNLTPLYYLNDDIFYVPNPGEPPVEVTLRLPVDQNNFVAVEFLNRANNYDIEVIIAQDDGAMQQYGQRMSSPKQYHWICDPTVARKASQIRLQRELYIPRSYKFSLPLPYFLLDPMDIVALTEPAAGLSCLPVRLVSVTESPEGVLEVEAEDLGINVVPHYPVQARGPGAISSMPPGAVSTPVFYEPGIRQTFSPDYGELWIGVAGVQWPGQKWIGGCDVYYSLTGGDDYQLLPTTSGGRIRGTAVMGVLLPPGLEACPTTLPRGDAGGYMALLESFSVDLTAIAGQLDSPRTPPPPPGFWSWPERALAIVDQGDKQELLGYGRVDSALSRYQYVVSELFRGMDGTDPIQHAAGVPFVQLGTYAHVLSSLLPDGFCVWRYPATLPAGTVIWFKFVGVDQTGNRVQDISTVQAVYQYTLVKNTSLVINSAFAISSTVSVNLEPGKWVEPHLSTPAGQTPLIFAASKGDMIRLFVNVVLGDVSNFDAGDAISVRILDENGGSVILPSQTPLTAPDQTVQFSFLTRAPDSLLHAYRLQVMLVAGSLVTGKINYSELEVFEYAGGL